MHAQACTGCSGMIYMHVYDLASKGLLLSTIFHNVLNTIYILVLLDAALCPSLKQAQTNHINSKVVMAKFLSISHLTLVIDLQNNCIQPKKINQWPL